MSKKKIYNTQSKVYEVVLDHNGVARRVPTGQGTHLIYESQFKETRMEQKSDVCIHYINRNPMLDIHLLIYIIIIIQYILPSTLSSLPRPPDTVYQKAPKMTWGPRRVGVSPVTDEKEPLDKDSTTAVTA